MSLCSWAASLQGIIEGPRHPELFGDYVVSRFTSSFSTLEFCEMIPILTEMQLKMHSSASTTTCK
eukprot:502932-Amphidinium_carterae.2